MRSWKMIPTARQRRIPDANSIKLVEPQNSTAVHLSAEIQAAAPLEIHMYVHTYSIRACRRKRRRLLFSL